MNIAIKSIKALFEPDIQLYIKYGDYYLSIFFQKYHEKYISNEILLDASIAEYLVENGYITIYSTMVDDLYKNLNLYTFILTSKSLLLIL
jgi:hypothetical protein